MAFGLNELLCSRLEPAKRRRNRDEFAGQSWAEPQPDLPRTVGARGLLPNEAWALPGTGRGLAEDYSGANLKRLKEGFDDASQMLSEAADAMMPARKQSQRA